MLRSDNGREFIAASLAEWLADHDPFQPRVLLLKRLEPLRLVLLERAVADPPPINTSDLRSPAACTPAGAEMPRDL
ncbi:MAG: hypothetical protein QOD85_359 [Gaiellaceae bacterium]|nr:hypothetical protein [Gaiellaceae bacterium]